MAIGEGILNKVIIAVVVLAILGATASLFFDNVFSVVDNVTSASTGSTEADLLLPVLGLLLAFTLVIAYVKMAQGSVGKKGHK